MMNKLWKKQLIVCCLLLSFAIQAVGCGRKDGENSEKSEYREAEQAENQNNEKKMEMTKKYQEFTIQLPDDVADILAIREVEGTVWMVTDQTVYSSVDYGESWEPADAETAVLPKECSAAAVSGKGTMAFASKDGSILVQKRNGTQDIIDGIFTNDSACYTLQFADESTLLATDVDSNIQVIDIAKRAVTGNISTEGEYHYLTVPIGGEILTLTGEGVKYYGYQGEMQDRNEVVNNLLSQDIADFNSSKMGVLVQDLEQNGFFYACKRGLYHYNLGGSITEQYIEGASNSMGDSECNFHRMAALSDQTFLIVYRKGSSEIMLKKYAVAENINSEISDGGTDALEGELTVYTLNKNILLEQEVNAINRNNPDCVVSIETGLTDEAGLTLDDAVKTLNTEILAGTGPDVIILDGMSVEQYCESGLLLNLYDVLEEIAGTEGVYENIAYAYEDNGAVYALPARFQFPIMVGEEDVPSQITELDSMVNAIKSLKEQHPEQTSITGLYNKGLLEYMFDFCAPSWISDSGKIDADRLKKFLEAVKTIEDVQKEGVNEADVEAITDSFVYSDDNAELDQPRYVAGGNQSMAFYLSKSLDFSMTLLEQIQDTTYAFDGARGQSSNVFIPKEIIAVNAKSKNQAAAVTFVKEFLSSSCQSTFKIEDTAYPVNKAALQSMEESKLQSAEDYGISTEKCREGFEKIKSVIENLSVCSVTDTVIRDAVIEQGLRYLNGELTLDEVADGIEQKVSLHMSE